jgi:hypothetical protein
MIRWDWSRERAAWRDVARSAAEVARTGGQALRPRRDAVEGDVARAMLDLVRKLAERAGFADGALRSRLSHGGEVADGAGPRSRPQRSRR